MAVLSQREHVQSTDNSLILESADLGPEPLAGTDSSVQCAADLVIFLSDHQERLKLYLEEWQFRQSRCIESALVGLSVPSDPCQLRNGDCLGCLPLRQGQGPSEPHGGSTQRVANLENIADVTESVHVLTKQRPSHIPDYVLSEDVSSGDEVEEENGRASSILARHGRSETLGSFTRANVEHKESAILAASLQNLEVKGRMAEFCERVGNKFGVALDTKPPNTRLVRWVDSRPCECVCITVILANAMFMAFVADYTMSHLGSTEPNPIEKVEIAFASFYIVEISLRLVAHGWRFFVNNDCAWNIFDFGLVLLTVYDFALEFITDQGQDASMTFMRLLRVMKMMKMFRMIRILRFFRELRLLMRSIMGSVKSLFWSLAMLFFITYIFGLIFLQASATYATRLDADPEDTELLIKHWGSVAKSMTSLYMSTTGGINWIDCAEPLAKTGNVFYFIFLFYIAFFMFVVINTLTALFVEATIENADRDSHNLIQEELAKKKSYIRDIRQLFHNIDSDDSGEISLFEFKDHLNSPWLYAFASALDLEASDIEEFFSLLSGEGCFQVDVDAFVVGCMKMRGAARSMDLLTLIHNQTKANHVMQDQLGILQRQLEQLASDSCLTTARPESHDNFLRRRGSGTPNGS